MKLILDTHALIWLTTHDKRISKKAVKAYLDKSNDIFFSKVSVWEMSIKISLGKLKVSYSLEEFIERHVIGNDIRLLNIETQHIYRLENLPFHHRDPFDRLIACQCIEEDYSLISSDYVFDKYSVKRLW